mmetsp:Transcript_93393/g.264394  ORF Transcript_93393/g.264394 Transcript_93393/m.264394 type:complete len:266 (-) Transcript_93393:89-886(-)
MRREEGLYDVVHRVVLDDGLDPRAADGAVAGAEHPVGETCRTEVVDARHHGDALVDDAHADGALQVVRQLRLPLHRGLRGDEVRGVVPKNELDVLLRPHHAGQEHGDRVAGPQLAGLALPKQPAVHGGAVRRGVVQEAVVRVGAALGPLRGGPVGLPLPYDNLEVAQRHPLVPQPHVAVLAPPDGEHGGRVGRREAEREQLRPGHLDSRGRARVEGHEGEERQLLAAVAVALLRGAAHDSHLQSRRLVDRVGVACLPNVRHRVIR